MYTDQHQRPLPPPISTDEYHKFMLKHASETKHAVQFIAWVVGIFAILSAIGVIYTAVQLAKIGNTLVPSDISNCQSLGGSDLSC